MAKESLVLQYILGKILRFAFSSFLLLMQEEAIPLKNVFRMEYYKNIFTRTGVE